MPPRIDRVRIVERIAEGGGSVLYRVFDERANEYRALKVLKEVAAADAGLLKSFRREGELLRELDNESLLKVHELGETAGTHWQLLEIFPGQNLKRLLQDKDPRLQEWVVPIAERVAAGLLELHLHGIIHKDVKPENVLVSDSGRVKLIDLSIAQPRGWLGSWLPWSRGVVQGTPTYMSPEQIRNEKLDHRSDVYSLGVTLYELISGHPPFVGRSENDVLQKHLNESPRSLKSVCKEAPEALCRLVMGMIEKSRDRRIQDMNLVLFELGKVKRASMPSLPAHLVKARGTRLAVQTGLIDFLRVDRTEKKGTEIRGKGAASNLSRSGLGFRTPIALEMDERLELHLTIPPLRAPLRFLVSVVWVTQSEGDEWRTIGARLLERPPDYLAQFEKLKEHLARM